MDRRTFIASLAAFPFVALSLEAKTSGKAIKQKFPRYWQIQSKNLIYFIPTYILKKGENQPDKFDLNWVSVNTEEPKLFRESDYKFIDLPSVSLNDNNEIVMAYSDTNLRRYQEHEKDVDNALMVLFHQCVECTSKKHAEIYLRAWLTYSKYQLFINKLYLLSDLINTFYKTIDQNLFDSKCRFSCKLNLGVI